jgi:hypothetical protein
VPHRVVALKRDEARLGPRALVRARVRARVRVRVRVRARGRVRVSSP